jgi:hypothetical protein
MLVHCIVMLFGVILGTGPTVGIAPAWQEFRGSSPQAMNFTVQGKITQLSSRTITLNTGENIIFRVRYDDQTEIKRADGSAGSAKDLHVRLTVTVEGDLTESGEIIAKRIEIGQEPSEKKPSQ